RNCCRSWMVLISPIAQDGARLKACSLTLGQLGKFLDDIRNATAASIVKRTTAMRRPTSAQNHGQVDHVRVGYQVFTEAGGSFVDHEQHHALTRLTRLGCPGETTQRPGSSGAKFGC